jgi:hypothetical protein
VYFDANRFFDHVAKRKAVCVDILMIFVHAFDHQLGLLLRRGSESDETNAGNQAHCPWFHLQTMFAMFIYIKWIQGRRL